MKRFAVYLVIVSQVLLLACSNDTTYHGSAQSGGLIAAFASSFNLGEKVFQVVRADLAAGAVTTTAQAEVAALDARHDDFVNSVNAVLTADSISQLGPTLAAVLGLVDDGTIQGMASNIADVLDSIASEPSERTLKALVALHSTRGVIQTDDVLAYIARCANFPEVDQVFGAVAQLIQQNDGSNGQPDLVHDVQGFVARLLREYAQSTGSTPLGVLDGLRQELLVDAPARGGAPGAMGLPSWAVRVDKNGNPAVATDASGQLFPPFVDDGTGVAAVDASGDPVDASGIAISIPPFGTPGAPGYDGNGLALAANGSDLLYVYFDAKETLLSHFLQLGGEGIRRNIHQQAFDVAALALGPRVTNDNGTPSDPSDDWLGFAATNPVPDLGWGLLELAKYDQAPSLCRAMANLLATDPALGEQLLVTVGKIVEKLRPIALAPSTVPVAQTRQLADDLVTLGDQVFQTPTSSTTSVGRDLFDVLHTIGQSARALPHELALMAKYSKLALDANGTPTAQSVAVDWSRAATTASTGGENRSTLHQLLDLLARADQCPTFIFAGQPLSETIIDLMAGQSVGTASTLIGFLQNPLARAAAGLACSGIGDDLDSLDALASSGALNGFLPIAKAFVDKGETRLLIDMLVTLDKSYGTVIRPNESQLANVLDSGAFDSIFDMLDLLVAGQNGQAIVDPATGARAIDVLADAVANLLAHPAGGVADRLGRKHATLFHLVADPLRAIEDEILAASGGQALHTALAYAVTDLIIERVTNAQGVEELANPSIVPFTSHMLDIVARNLPASATTRASTIATSQQSLCDALAGHDFATAFDLGKVLRNSTASPLLADALQHGLTPDPVAQEDVFGALMKLLAGVVQTSYDPAPLRDLAAFGGDLFDPAQGKVVPLVTGLAKLLVADQGKTCITLARNALNVPPAAAGLAPGATPAQTLLSVYDDVNAAKQAGGAPAAADQVAELKDILERAVAFIRDQQAGVAYILNLIANRPR